MSKDKERRGENPIKILKSKIVQLIGYKKCPVFLPGIFFIKIAILELMGVQVLVE